MSSTATDYLSKLKDMDKDFASYMIMAITLILLAIMIWYIISLTKLEAKNNNFMNDLLTNKIAICL